MTPAALLPWAALYLYAARSVRWPRRRTLAFVGGLIALGAAAALGDQPLARHMFSHVLIVGVAAPLLVLGAPVGLALRALPRAERHRLAHLLRARPLRTLLHPVAAWLAFVATQIAFHLPPLLDLAPRHPLLHAAPLRSVYLLAAMPAVDVAGVYLMATGRGAAGAVMLAGSMPLALAAVAATWKWLSAEEARARRKEALGAAAN
jgi:cytochrome c oxidase assembly factor CtaG